MDFYDKAERLSNKDFKQIIGVEKVTFDAMVTILKEAEEVERWAKKEAYYGEPASDDFKLSPSICYSKRACI